MFVRVCHSSINLCVRCVTGHVIFMGMAEKAAAFFLRSPRLELQQQALAGADAASNAADFLVDLAGGFVKNDNDELLGCLALAENYKGSNLFAAFKASTRHLGDEEDAEGDVEVSASVHSGGESGNGGGSVLTTRAASTSSTSSYLHFTSKYVATSTSTSTSASVSTGETAVVSPYRAPSSSR